MKTNIQETINHLRELDRKASPAPWWVGTTKSCGRAVLCEHYDEIVEAVIDAYWEGEPIDDNSPDLQLIVQARNSLPTLITEIDRLSNALRVAEARLGRVATNHPEAYLDALGGD